MQRISANQSAEDFLNTLKPLERLDFIKDSIETYPIQDNVSGYQGISKSKRVYTTIDSLVLGQFIMLEQIITGKTKFENENQRDLEFAKLILRPKHHKEFDNQIPSDEVENEKKILSSPVQDVYSVVYHYLENRDFVLFKQFSGVFYEIPDEDEIEEGEVEKKTNENLFHNQWYWYSIVRMLAKEDITKYDEIYMLPMRTVLPEMSYITQKEKIESAERKKQEALNKL